MSRFFPKDGRPHLASDETGKGGELSLLSLPGVGRSRAQALINAGYRSLREVADAPLDELREVPGVGPETAEQLKEGALRALSEAEPERARPTVVPIQRGADPEPDLGQTPLASGEFEPATAPATDEEALPTSAYEAANLGGQASAEPGVSIESDGDEPEIVIEPSEPEPEIVIEWADLEPEIVIEPAEPEPEIVIEPAEPEPEIVIEPAEPEIVIEPGDDSEIVAAPEAGADSPTPTIPDRGGPDAGPLLEESFDVHLSVHIESALLTDFDRLLAQEFAVVPIQRIGDAVLVASEDPLSDEQLEELAARAGVEIKAIPSQVPNVDATLRALYDDNSLRSRPKGLGEILIDLGLLTPQQLGQALAHQMRENNPFFRPVLSIPHALLQLVPEGLGRKYNVLPLYRIGDTLLLATSEHLSPDALLDIRRTTGLEPELAIVGPSELQEAMTACYQVRQKYELRQMWIGEILISRSLITRQELDTCLAAQSQSRKKLGQLLVENGYITEDVLYPILAEKLGLEYRRFEPQEADYQLTYLISDRFAERNLVLPLRQDYDNDVLEIAISDPTNLQVRDMLDLVAENQGQKLKLVLSGPTRLKEAIDHAYNFNKQMEVDLADLEIEADTEWDEELEDLRHEITITQDLPKMRKIVNKLLYEAVTEAASDIHIENLEARTQVRFRIDGLLHERTTPINKSNIQKIISVLKIDSGLNIAERRRAQDGVFKMRIGKDRNIDFRINVHATQFGEDAVIRVLDRSRNLMGLGELGFAPFVQARYEALVENPQGLILITGPTGSGKTTTLYSSLDHLNKGDKKIVTAEDPVEYHLDGITQYQVNVFIGNTFAEYTRRFLRKDPDIILVGEIRDDETAISCIRAAMTGHLVFSTLHTNDALSVIQRLRDLGLDSSSLADALLCVIQQRLARRNCSDCRKPYTPDPSIMREFYPTGEVPEEAHFVHGSGCPNCHGKGLRGRVGLYEFWEVKRATRQAIATGADENEVRTSAEEHGIVPLVEDALRKVYEGTTTLEELRRVVPVEQIRHYSGYYNVQGN